jgi:hypothetical protein
MESAGSAVPNATEVDHIVLGYANGSALENAAAQVGGRTLLEDPLWKTTLQNAIADPTTKFTVSLDGMPGSSTYSAVMSAVQRGVTGAGGATDWEMSLLYQAGRLKDVTFIQAGKPVANPFK